MTDVKVLIMEDEPNEALSLQQLLREIGYGASAVAASLPQGLDMFQQMQPDICLVDLFFNGRPDGILFGKEINSLAAPPKPFLFLTPALDAATFQMAEAAHPFHYLIKPFDKPELRLGIELALLRQNIRFPSNRQPNPSSIFVKRGNILHHVPYNDIVYIEVDGKYSRLCCRNQKFVVQQSLGDLLTELPAGQFVRVHRKYVVNSKEVDKIDLQTHEVHFHDGKMLSFSRRYLKEFLGAFRLIR